MKKIFLILLFLVLSTMEIWCADWLFRSGSSDIRYKHFYKAVVYNYSGRYIECNGQTVYNNSHKTFYDDNVYIHSDSYSRMTAQYDFNGSTLYVYIVKD